MPEQLSTSRPPTPDHGEDQSRRRLALWIAVGGSFAVIFAAWVLLLPSQLVSPEGYGAFGLFPKDSLMPIVKDVKDAKDAWQRAYEQLQTYGAAASQAAAKDQAEAKIQPGRFEPARAATGRTMPDIEKLKARIEDEARNSERRAAADKQVNP